MCSWHDNNGGKHVSLFCWIAKFRYSVLYLEGSALRNPRCWIWHITQRICPSIAVKAVIHRQQAILALWPLTENTMTSCLKWLARMAAIFNCCKGSESGDVIKRVRKEGKLLISFSDTTKRGRHRCQIRASVLDANSCMSQDFTFQEMWKQKPCGFEIS